MRFKRIGKGLSAEIRVGQASVRALNTRTASCEVLAKGVAVTLAMLIDSDTALQPSAQEEPEPAPPATSPELSEHSAPLLVASPDPHVLRGFLSVGAGGLGGVLGPIGPALVLEGGLRAGTLRVGWGLIWGVPRKLDLAAGSITESLFAATLRACTGLVGGERLNLGVCAGAFAGELGGSAYGFVAAEQHHRAWLVLPVDILGRKALPTQLADAGAGGDAPTPILSVDAGSAEAGQGGVSGVIIDLPSGFTAADNGGYKLGPPIVTSAMGAGGDGGSANPSDTKCGNILLGVVRDFRGAQETGGHPDFEAIVTTQVTPKLVGSALGMDRKPVYASHCEVGAVLDAKQCPEGAETTSAAHFDEWYRNTDGVNLPYVLYFYFQPENNGLFLFQSSQFFPLDVQGFGNTPGNSHNYSFTSELHTKFKYVGGETFDFKGDDDVWVFINGQLAVDLGGIHLPTERSIHLDQAAAALGIVPGGVYALDLFQAERHTSQSNFRVETNLAFVNCGYIEPEVVK